MYLFIRDERELRFNCSRLALLSVLRSWPGILHFCSPTNTSGLQAIVDVLYLNQLEVRVCTLCSIDIGTFIYNLFCVANIIFIFPTEIRFGFALRVVRFASTRMD